MSQNDGNDEDDTRLDYTLFGVFCGIFLGIVLSWQFGWDAIGKLVAIASVVVGGVVIAVHYGSRIGRL